jgi:hypothetical protein
LVGVKDVGETGCVPYPSSLISWFRLHGFASRLL